MAFSVYPAPSQPRSPHSVGAARALLGDTPSLVIGLGIAINASAANWMFRQFLVGGGVSLVTIAIHALVMIFVVQVARAMGSKRQPHSSLVLIAVMIPTVSVLMVAHVLEVFVWALAYLIFDAAPAGTDLVYFAFVNYTTLGYGDVLPVERWRLLGAITAMTGMLLFGWSTAVIFEVLRRTLVRTLDLKD